MRNPGYVLRVLLINSNMKSDLFAAPPIGLCYVAQAAKEAGHEVTVLDLCFKRNIARELKNAVRSLSPEIVGISIRNIDNANMLHPESFVPTLEDTVKELRKNSTVPLVLGGSGASLSPAGLMDRLKADFIVVSDGERSFVDLLDRLGKGEAPASVPGVGMMVGREFHLTPPELKAFTVSNPQVGDWVDVTPYRNIGASYNVQTKRGCRHKCIYCVYNQVLEGSRLRLRPPVEVVDELEEVVRKYRPSSIEFVDSVFNDPSDHCAQILEELVRRPWKANFNAMGVSPKNLDGKFLNLMQRAGFSSFWMTPESASQTMIESYQKGFSVEDVIRAAEAINNTRFTVAWNFLIGGPGETNGTLQETLDFALRYLKRDSRPPWNISQFYVGVRVYPRTKMWEIAEATGYVTSESDPLDQLWYLSEELDLTQAIRQLVAAARLSPEIISGFDERYLKLSWISAWLEKLLKRPKLYWKLMYWVNRTCRTSLLRVMFRPDQVAAALSARLQKQTCKEPPSPQAANTSVRS